MDEMDEMYIIIASKIKIWQVIFFFNCGLFLNYILNTHTNRKKRQICQVITQGFSKGYNLTVDANDVGVEQLDVFLINYLH
jgi:hypothetical protein